MEEKNVKHGSLVTKSTQDKDLKVEDKLVKELNGDNIYSLRK